MTGPRTAPPIVDTHMHLDESSFDIDRDEVLDASRAAGVRRFINIGYKPERWASSRALRESQPDVDIVLGLHPQEAAAFNPALERMLLETIEELQPLAIGEMGFDFARSAPTHQEQERAFRGQIELAASLKLPVVIHQRGAADALISELDRWPSLASIVLHSFDGTDLLADWARERRCYIGIGGLATRQSSSHLRILLERMPVERLLLETDSPYLAPPGASSRRNTPANLPAIATILAPLWNLNGEELCWTTAANANALFALGIDESRTAPHDAP